MTLHEKNYEHKIEPSNHLAFDQRMIEVSTRDMGSRQISLEWQSGTCIPPTTNATSMS